MDKCKEMDAETQEFYYDLILLENFWNKTPSNCNSYSKLLRELATKRITG